MHFITLIASLLLSSALALPMSIRSHNAGNDSLAFGLRDAIEEGTSLKKRQEDNWHLGLEEYVEKAQEEILIAEAYRKHTSDMRAEYLAGHIFYTPSYSTAVNDMNVSEANALAAVKKTTMTPAQVQNIHKREILRGNRTTSFPRLGKLPVAEKAVALYYAADRLLDHAREIQAKYGSKDWEKSGTLGPTALRLAIVRYNQVLGQAHKAVKKAFRQASLKPNWP